jgi:hypothetical protein
MDSNQQPMAPQQPLPPQPYMAPQENPGQTLGIVSIILSVPFSFFPVGLVLGIISRNQSKKVGASTTLGTVGMVIGIIGTVFSVILVILWLLLIVFVAANKDNTDTYTTSGSATSSFGASTGNYDLKQDALDVASKAEIYKTIDGDYPKDNFDFNKYDGSKIPSDILLFGGSVVTSTALTYMYCSPGSAQIVYQGTSKSDLRIKALGTASSSVTCKTVY